MNDSGVGADAPASMLRHPSVPPVGDVQVSRRVDCHTLGILEPCERQARVGADPARRRLHHPLAAQFGDVHVARPVDRYTPEIFQPANGGGFVAAGAAADLVAGALTRSATYTLPAVSTATP